VVLGKVRGNLTASDRVDIRSEGSLTGDVIAQRISIEDGAYFKGGIDIRKPGGDATKPATPGASTSTSTAAPNTGGAPVVSSSSEIPVATRQ
jgi:cytoskeletal protein CcmA (bactofilin family)